MLLEKLAMIEERFEEVKRDIVNPEIMQDMRRYAEINKEYKKLDKIVSKSLEYKNVLSNIDTSKQMLDMESDEEMRELAKEELEILLPERDSLAEEIKLLLIPEDPNDSKNVILEIRSGTGGDEASLFAGNLFRMYQRFCESRNWRFEISDYQEGTSGGFKEVVVMISGEDAFGTLKYESGVHRVQRVPATESQGRVHTSAATVAILPEAEEFDIDLKQSDIKKETFCASGPGGQSVNTTYSAVRLTHVPTGIVVSNQDQKSQIKNLEKAMKILRSRIYDLEMAKVKDSEDALRRSMVSTGDRSAKIRTYNYPQNRVTDHRINLTLYKLDKIIDGDISQIIEQLRLADNAAKLQAGSTM